MKISRDIAMCCLMLSALLCGCGSDRSDDFLTEGRKLMEQGNPGGAVVFFKNALENNPGDYGMHLELGKAYLKLGKFNLAEVELQKCYRQQPGDPGLNLALGELYVKRSNPDAAQTHLAQFESSVGATAASREFTGVALYQQKHSDEARHALEQSIELDPSRVSSRLVLARLHQARGDLAAARAVTDKAVEVAPTSIEALKQKADLFMQQGDMEQALATFRQVTAQYPHEEYSRYMVGALLLQTGKVEEARAALDAMRLDFKDSSLAFLLGGMLASQEHDYAEAVTLFQRSVALRPSVDGYFKLGVALYAKGDLEIALSQFQRILDVAPRHSAARRMVATTLLRQKRTGEAIEEARRLLADHPGDAAAHLLLANAYLAEGDTSGAEKEFEASLAIDSGQIGALLQISALRQSVGRMDEALEDLKMAVVVAPASLAARNAIYSFYLARGDLAKAEVVVREGLNGTPQDAVLYSMLVPLHAREKDDAKALDAIAKAHVADPGFAEAYMLGARLHAAAGRNGQALAECDAYLAYAPDAQGFLVASGALLDLLGRTEEADARYARALLGKNPRVVLLAATREAAAGRPEKSRKLLEAALAVHDMESLREALAVLYVRSSQPDKAIALYDALEITRPHEAAIGRYRLLMSLGKNEDAVAVGRKMMQREPASPLGAILVATAFESMGKRKDGLRELDAAYNHVPSPDLLVAMGGMSERDGDPVKAETYYRKALKLKGDSPAMMALAGLHMRRNELAPAIELYSSVVSLQPDNVVALNNLAMAYSRKNGEQRRALQLSLQAYMRSPDSVDVLDTLGTCLMLNDRADDASRAFTRAVALWPENPTLRYRLAESHFKAGRKEQAAEHARVALTATDFPEAGKARELLGKAGN